MSERSNNTSDDKSDGGQKKSVKKKRNVENPKESLKERMSRKMAAMEADNKKPSSSTSPASPKKESLEERMARKMAAMEADKKPASSTTAPVSPKKESLEERMARKMAAMEGRESSSSTASPPRDETREEKFARKMKAMEKNAKSPTKSETKEERFARKMAEDETARGAKKDTKEEKFARKMAQDEQAGGAVKKETKEARFARKMAQDEQTRGAVNKKTKEERLSRKMAEDDAARGAKKGLTQNFETKEVSKETNEDKFARKMEEGAKARGVRNETREERLVRKMKEFLASDTSKEVRRSLKEKEARRVTAVTIASTGVPNNEEPDIEDHAQELLSYDEDPEESDETNIDRLSTGVTTKSDQRTRPVSGDESYVPGAYHVESRAMGALPAWAPSRYRRETVEGEDDDHDDLPPELRNVSEVPPEMRTNDHDADSGPNLSPELRAGGGSSGSLVQDVLIPGMELPAEVAAVTAMAEKESKPKRSARRFWIITGVTVAIGVAIAVGIGIALSSGDDGGDTGGTTVNDQCDFTAIEQPSVFLQCLCNQEITKWSEYVYARYQDLVTTVIPEVNLNFAEPESSCANSNLALAWLATDDYSSTTTDMVILKNRYVLALLFQTWMGTKWKRNDGWLSSQSECGWYGITCDGMDITEIELGANNLQSGPEDGLPAELFTLTSLKSFNASDATLNGIIQSGIGSLLNLEILDLASFQSDLGQYPDELFSLPRLRVLDLSYSSQGGTIPTVVGSATRLESFVANRAGLVGTIPSEIGLMTSLGTLSFDVNSLSGTFPAEISDLSVLETLVLSSNKIESEIPTTLGVLSSLAALDLGYNVLRGSIPIEVASLPNLRIFRLRENRLSGTVPEAVLASGKLECFDASSNLMENYIPQGECPADTNLLTVCDKVDDPTCSCCTCAEISGIDYCKVQLAS